MKSGSVAARSNCSAARRAIRPLIVVSESCTDCVSAVRFASHNVARPSFSACRDRLDAGAGSLDGQQDSTVEL